MNEYLDRFEILNRVTVVAGNGGLPKFAITTPWSTTEIYLHGAHVTHFQKNNEPPLLWMSGKSLFAKDKAIRGGVPICFPWFGPRDGKPAHGFARITDWELAGTNASPDGSVSVRLRLPANAGGADAFRGKVEFIVTVGETLTMELHVANTSGEPVSFEDCLHTYFTVGDVGEVAITGLTGGEYLDKVNGGTRKRESADAILISSEVDRVYFNTATAVEIHDAKLRRVIHVEKSGSRSTVVWNPWVAKSKAMADFGDGEFHGMVCVESGNVAQNLTTLPPGESSTLRVVLSSKQV